MVSDEGGDGQLRAGDRLPDVPLAGGATLLGEWRSGRHLAVLLNGKEDTLVELRTSLRQADVIAIRSDQLNAEGRRLLGEKATLLLTRPDGYVGFRGSPEKSAAWQAYARQDAM